MIITLNINTLFQKISQADEYNRIVNDIIITYKRLRKRNFSDAPGARNIYEKLNVLGKRSNTPKIITHFEPLGMKSTVNWSDIKQIVKNKAIGYEIFKGCDVVIGCVDSSVNVYSPIVSSDFKS